MQRIGILGGSFNPAHEGHIYISKHAIKSLNLHQIWWLVAKQNPYKPLKDIYPFDFRVNYAKELVKKYPKIRVSKLELKVKATETIFIIKYILNRYQNTRFFWIMGADNLEHFHKWRGSKLISKKLPIVIFDRSQYFLKNRNYPFINYMRDYRLHNPYFLQKKYLATSWSYIKIARKNISATEIRKQFPRDF